ncbi:helix-turn-helix domain-containing protein [Phaeobacter sp. PT47_59]|uniref:helix-turn-helix domain-containing protein n=1 Tax=Phaeobacter sp. PT47_59 TaxID=3029979 RepID=UPI0023803D25|nr:helix-turn-helix domain-containing protein [Phaeobacter sp. PT47_59]MDE4175784.1 helix-turn-helix domain-containing protein [Phaeobacter sp. PT47_59]
MPEELAYPKPPAQVEPYIEALGLEDTLRFLDAFGGVEAYIANQPSARSRVVQLVGLPKAKMLAENGSRLQRRVPLAKEWRAAVYHSQGLPTVEIALKLGVTDVSVRRWLKKPGVRRKPEPNQLPLFPGV